MPPAASIPIGVAERSDYPSPCQSKIADLLRWRKRADRAGKVGARRSGERDQVQRKIRKVVEGNREAAGWLYDTFSDRLFRRLRQRYGYAGGLDTEDLLQDTFILLFQHDYRVLRRFLDRHTGAELQATQVERYLWDLACGIATNRRRSAVRRKVVPLIEPEREQVDPTAERAVVDRDTLLQLDACLQGRGTRVHLYHQFRHRDGLTPSEIAQITGWSRKAVYKLKQAFNDALRACAEHLGIEQG